MKRKITILYIIYIFCVSVGLLLSECLDAQDKRFALKTVVIDA